ncbi:MAG: EAL domain-containing protein [Cognaticolwellia sp.]
MAEVKQSSVDLQEQIARLTAELAQEKQNNLELEAAIKLERNRTFSLEEDIGGRWDWHLDTDEVTYSSSWMEMLGYAEGELESHLDTWKKLVHPADKEEVLNKAQNFLLGKSDFFDAEMRMRHKNNSYIFVSSRGVYISEGKEGKAIRLIGTHVDITERKKAELFERRNTKILKMIATGQAASNIYDEIALMYEERHHDVRCSLLELHGNVLLHGGAPSLPKAYCDAVNGLKNGPNVGSCGTSTYTGKRVIVEDIATDPKWEKIKHVALPHGMRCCWSEPIKNSDGKVLGALGMYCDYPARPNEQQSLDLTSAARLAGIIMEREHNQKKILNLAYVDELTGLSSRTYFYINLEELIRASKRYKRRFSVLYLDLDNFKTVNDSCGHDAGDLLLKEIATRLNQTRRDVDFVARLSGDEFCIVVKNLDDGFDGTNVAKRCLDAIAQPFDLAGQKYTPSCSIGIAHYPDNGENTQTLLKAADTALYSAKNLGRNRYAFYNKYLTEQAEYRLQVEQSLRDAINNKQLSLVYQPKINLKTHEIVGVEVLCRWEHAEFGDISPTEFIATAERISMLKPLTKWVLQEASKQAVTWLNNGLPALRIAINISPSLFLDDELVPMVKDVIAKTNICPTELELEVTESIVQTNNENLSIFKRLNDLGVILAIDDFGKGYSSFASLKHIHINSLKIDKYFIDDISIDEKSFCLVRSMVEMGHDLGYEVVAEGIETQEQLNIVKKLGCDTAQGFLFSQPVSADAIVELFTASVCENF